MADPGDPCIHCGKTESHVAVEKSSGYNNQSWLVVGTVLCSACFQPICTDCAIYHSRRCENVQEMESSTL